jgi:predicted MFS family arabinose efflux permease
MVWATELAVRRRMIGEVVMPGQVGPAVAFDSLTNSIARVLGPIIGGAVFEILGLGGAYFLSAALYLAAGLVITGLDFHQEPRKLRFGRIPADIAEGLAVARTNPAILTVVMVSIIMNAFAFSYSALIAPIGLDGYGVSPLLVGALAAAEPLGAIATGISLSAGWLRLDGRRALLRGSFLFLAGLAAMALSPWYTLAFFWIDSGTGHRVCALIDVIWRTEPVMFNRAQTLRNDVDQLLAALVRIGVAEAARLERALLASTPDG